MSYKCQQCGETQAGSPKKIVTKTRKKEYEEKEYYEKGRKKIEKGGSGWEIVEEKQVCKECFNKHERNL